MAEVDFNMQAPGPWKPEVMDLANALGVTPEEVMMLDYQARHPELMGQLDERMAEAQALRDPRARGRQAGGVYVAANPLEHIADLLRGRKGRKEAEAIRGERTAAQEDLSRSLRVGALAELRAREDETGLIRDYINALSGEPGAAPAASPGPGVAAPAPNAGVAPAPAPGPVGGPPPQINPQLAVAPQIGALRNPGMPQAGMAQMAGAVPRERGWFEQNPARQAMGERLGVLNPLNWERMFSRELSAKRRGDYSRPRMPEPVRYPWPGGHTSALGDF